MQERQCDNCCYYDLCHRNEPCEDYTPCDVRPSDEDIEDMIEQKRIVFRGEWFGYIEDEDDGLLSYQVNDIIRREERLL